MMYVCVRPITGTAQDIAVVCQTLAQLGQLPICRLIIYSVDGYDGLKMKKALGHELHFWRNHYPLSFQPGSSFTFIRVPDLGSNPFARHLSTLICWRILRHSISIFVHFVIPVVSMVLIHEMSLDPSG